MNKLRWCNRFNLKTGKHETVLQYLEHSTGCWCDVETVTGPDKE